MYEKFLAQGFGGNFNVLYMCKRCGAVTFEEWGTQIHDQWHERYGDR